MIAIDQDWSVASGGLRVSCAHVVVGAVAELCSSFRDVSGGRIMTSTTAEALRNDMKVRMSMQEGGITLPHPSVADATRQLVAKLSCSPPMKPSRFATMPA
jgi:hypothetical protein